MTEASKGERTRHKLVAATGELLRRQGFHATGLAEIITESGAPRGSLYFHFPGGKDELACAALEAAGAAWRTRIEHAVAAEADLGRAILAVVRLLADDLEASQFEHGCPVAAVALESTSPAVRAAVVAHYAAWQTGIAAHLIGTGMAEGPARQLTIVALAAIEGALLLARVQRSREPLEVVGQMLAGMATNRAPGARGPG